MWAQISAGDDCLWFPQVTGGIIPAPAANFRESLLVRLRADFVKLRDVFFNPIPNTFNKITTRCLRSQYQTLQICFCSKIVGLFIVGASERYSTNPAGRKNLHYHQNFQELAVVTFPTFSLIPSEGKMLSKSRSWSWIPLETQCIFDEHYGFLEKHWNISKRRNVLLPVRGNFLLKFGNPVFQRRSDQIVLKPFVDFISARTEMCKNCSNFIFFAEIKSFRLLIWVVLWSVLYMCL